MARDYIGTILVAVTVLLTIFAAFMVMWKLFGNSPTIEQLTLSLLAMTAAWLFSLSYKFGNLEGKYVQSEKNMRESFARAREDLSNLKKDLREDLSEIKKDLSELRRKSR